MQKGMVIFYCTDQSIRAGRLPHYQTAFQSLQCNEGLPFLSAWFSTEHLVTLMFSAAQFFQMSCQDSHSLIRVPYSILPSPVSCRVSCTEVPSVSTHSQTTASSVLTRLLKQQHLSSSAFSSCCARSSLGHSAGHFRHIKLSFSKIPWQFTHCNKCQRRQRHVKTKAFLLPDFMVTGLTKLNFSPSSIAFPPTP